MGNVFRVINSNGDIEITMYRKANAVFKTNEYNETDNICTYKETINIFDLLKENQELKSQLAGTTFCYDEEEHRKLENNWNELKRWLYEEHYLYVPEIARNSIYQKVLEKMYEIEKESNSNEYRKKD